MFVKNKLELEFTSSSQVRHIVCIPKSYALLYFKSGDYHLIDLLTSQKLISGKLPINIIEIQHFIDSYVTFFTNNGIFNVFDIFNNPNDAVFKSILPTITAAGCIPEGNTRLLKSIQGQTFLKVSKNEKKLFVLERLIGVGAQVKNIITVWEPLSSSEPVQILIQDYKFPLNLTLMPNSKKLLAWDQSVFDFESLKALKKGLSGKPQFFVGDFEDLKCVFNLVELGSFDYEEKKDSMVVGIAEHNEPNKFIAIENTTNIPKIRIVCLDTKAVLNTILLPFDPHGMCVTNFIKLEDLRYWNKRLLVLETETDHSQIATYTFANKSYLAGLHFAIDKANKSYWKIDDDGCFGIELPNHQVIEENQYKAMKLKMNYHRRIRKRLVSLYFLLKLLGTYHIYALKMCFDMLP